jgi:hypothetical protein
MASTDPLSARCLCGAVTLTIHHKPSHFDACHCGMCRKWGGGPALGFSCEELEVSDPSQVGIYASSAWAQRAFCRQCGTHLYFQLQGKDLYFVPAGFFPHLTDVPFTEEIFIDERPPYYAFANDTIKLTGEEVVRKYASLMGQE